MRWWRLASMMLAGALAAAVATVLAIAVNIATGGTARWFPAVERHPLWWMTAATAAVALTGLLVWGTQRWYDRTLKELIPARHLPESWMVDRPAEVDQIVAALRRRREGGTVGITTAAQGAGGFGKTTVARMVRADKRVLRMFHGRVYWVTVGRDAGNKRLTKLVNGLIAQLEPGRAVTFTVAEQAAEHLGALLAKGPRRLLILDDVWSDEQMDVFPVTGRSARLVTTRNLSLAATASAPVKVDQMSPAQGRAVLLAGLPPLSPAVTEGLLAVTGRWPLLLRLVNRRLAAYKHVQGVSDLSEKGKELLWQLRASGPSAVDAALDDPISEVDLNKPKQRAKAVRATIEASTSLLGRQDARRFAELAVFAQDEVIPFNLIARLWQATADVDEQRAGEICKRLAELALLSAANAEDGKYTLHDVVRDFLRNKLGKQLTELNELLLTAVAANLPPASPLDPTQPTARVAWWELSDGDRYLWEHLIEHLQDAGQLCDAEAVAGDLRWVGARLKRFGPAGPAADLSEVATARAARLRRVLVRAAHLLAPTEPAEGIIDVLHSRVAEDPDWKIQVAALHNACHMPRLVNRWLPPDLADSPLRQAMTGQYVQTVAVAPDGSWLASGGWDATVRIWDVATGKERAILKGHEGTVYAVAVAPDGSWLASGGKDKTVRIWDAVTGEQRAILKGHRRTVYAVAVAPDGNWLASGSNDKTVRIWDVATRTKRATLKGHRRPVYAVVVAPDGSWLASGSKDKTVRIWDVATRTKRATLKGHAGHVKAVQIAPDNTWLASGSTDKTVRIWDLATGQERAILKGHSEEVYAVTGAPDGTWLASGGWDTTVRLWDAATWAERAILKGHSRDVKALAVAPDGTWLASGSTDKTVRIWDVATGQEPGMSIGHVSSMPLAVAPDGTWLASGGGNATVRIWDGVTGHIREILKGHTGDVKALAVAPDGTWLASGSTDKTVRIWDMATPISWRVVLGRTERRRTRAILKGHRGTVTSLAIGPDGTWLASGADDGNIRIWDLTTSRTRAELMSIGASEAVAIAPDGTWLASCGPGKWIRIRDVATRQERATLKGHRDDVKALAVAPDGTWLASGATDGTVRIWDMNAREQRAILEGHRRPIYAVAVAPDDTWLASGDADGTVRIWDMTTKQTRTLMRIDDTVTACAWLRLNTLAVAGAAGVYLFDFLTETS